MQWIRKLATRSKGVIIHSAATLMLAVGTSAVHFSAVPLWHNEPEMPQSMLDAME